MFTCAWFSVKIGRQDGHFEKFAANSRCHSTTRTAPQLKGTRAVVPAATRANARSLHPTEGPATGALAHGGGGARGPLAARRAAGCQRLTAGLVAPRRSMDMDNGFELDLDMDMGMAFGAHASSRC